MGIPSGLRLAMLLTCSGLPFDAPAAEVLQVKPPVVAPKAPTMTPAPAPFKPMLPVWPPRQVATPEITMTGRRFLAQTIATDEIAMTGSRMAPVSVETGEISMTGRR